jgi:hypothetical protein
VSCSFSFGDSFQQSIHQQFLIHCALVEGKKKINTISTCQHIVGKKELEAFMLLIVYLKLNKLKKNHVTFTLLVLFSSAYQHIIFKPLFFIGV